MRYSYNTRVLTVHHLENSRSQRVLWLLEELGVPYEIVRYKRDPETLLAPPELAKVHPLGKSPVITDGGDTIAESGAILEYIADKYGEGKLVPARGTPGYAKVRYFMHYAEGSLMPVLLLKLVFGRVKTAKMPFFVKPIARGIAGKVDAQFIAPNLARHVAFLDGELANSPWLAGETLTLADIQMSYPLEALVARAPDVPARITDYVKRAQARPAYKAAEAKGGPSMVD
jgi:glutathione S-transferase